jgi:hypothetical protein
VDETQTIILAVTAEDVASIMLAAMVMEQTEAIDVALRLAKIAEKAMAQSLAALADK